MARKALDRSTGDSDWRYRARGSAWPATILGVPANGSQRYQRLNSTQEVRWMLGFHCWRDSDVGEGTRGASSRRKKSREAVNQDFNTLTIANQRSVDVRFCEVVEIRHRVSNIWQLVGGLCRCFRKNYDVQTRLLRTRQTILI